MFQAWMVGKTIVPGTNTSNCFCPQAVRAGEEKKDGNDLRLA